MSDIKMCCECFQVLTDEEIKYYENLCEICTKEQHERIKSWKAGEEDKELDAKYGLPEETRH